MNAHQLDANGVIINTIVVDSLNVFPNLIDASISGTIGDSIINGAVVPKAIPAPTESEYITAVQSYLDGEAKAHGYDGILSATSYATSTNAHYKAEGQACVEWRDAVWSAAFEAMNGEPTIDALVAGLPAMVWPVVP